MVIMTTPTFHFHILNLFAYHNTTRLNLQAIPRHVEVHRGLVVKDFAKVNATSVGAARTTFLKPKMMLEQNKNHPYMVTDLGLGRMLKDGFVFRQKIHIRSYEVGPDRTITTETLTNLLQETSINHFKAIGVWDDGLGLTREMRKKNLIWVMAKLQVVVDRYPIWGDIIQIDTWKGAYGNFGMCSNWTFSDVKTGEILLRASCIWLMMNKETRRVSKFPAEVRGELDEHFTHATPPKARKQSMRDESVVGYAHTGLVPRWSDLDINQHVNNAKYIGWIFQNVPHSIMENYELANMSLEYCRECRKDNMLQSRTYVMETDSSKLDDHGHVNCEHVVQVESGGGEIMKGWTTWRPKH